MTEFKLGTTIRDKVSGIQGIAVSRHEMFNGNLQYGIESRAKDEKRSEVVSCDFHQIEAVPDDPVIESLPTVHQTTDFVIGDQLEDIVTGLKGTLTEKTLFMNGCLYLQITTRTVDSFGSINTHFLPVARFKKVGKSLFEKIGDTIRPKPEPVIEPVKQDAPPRPTGGPTRAGVRER